MSEIKNTSNSDNDITKKQYFQPDDDDNDETGN